MTVMQYLKKVFEVFKNGRKQQHNKQPLLQLPILVFHNLDTIY